MSQKMVNNGLPTGYLKKKESKVKYAKGDRQFSQKYQGKITCPFKIKNSFLKSQ